MATNKTSQYFEDGRLDEPLLTEYDADGNIIPWKFFLRPENIFLALPTLRGIAFSLGNWYESKQVKPKDWFKKKEPQVSPMHVTHLDLDGNIDLSNADKQWWDIIPDRLSQEELFKLTQVPLMTVIRQSLAPLERPLIRAVMAHPERNVVWFSHGKVYGYGPTMIVAEWLKQGIPGLEILNEGLEHPFFQRKRIQHLGVAYKLPSA